MTKMEIFRVNKHNL